MEKKCSHNWLMPTNRILLGLLMLIAGLMKLFVIGSDNISGMLAGIGFPIPLFFAWVLIIAEIFSGAAILANWKLKQVIILPVIILVISAFTQHISDINRIILHLIVISNYLILGYNCRK